MNYQSKYLKYKEKYLKLQNQKGGTNINLSGPVSIHYYENIKLNKKIIVLGDYHKPGEEGICNFIGRTENDIPIEPYLYKLFDDKSINFDFFIEMDIPDKESLISGIVSSSYPLQYGQNFIRDIGLFGFKKYKKDPNKKVHFTDIRDNIYGYKEFCSFRFIPKLIDQIAAFKEEVNLLGFYKAFTGDFTNSCVALLDYINKIENPSHQNNFNEFANNFYNKILPNILIKEINRTNPLIVKKLIIITKKYIEEYLKELEIKDRLINLLNIDELYIINQKGFLVTIAIMDLYTVLRIIKSKDISNSIIYTGALHTKTIKEYFLELDFNMIKEIENIDNDLMDNSSKAHGDEFFINLQKKNPLFRCLRDITSFEEFFKIPSTSVLSI
jgi:hypothetical protein